MKVKDYGWLYRAVFDFIMDRLKINGRYANIDTTPVGLVVYCLLWAYAIYRDLKI